MLPDRTRSATGRLSTKLFITVMEYALKHLESQSKVIKIDRQKFNDFRYADNIALISGDLGELGRYAMTTRTSSQEPSEL